MEDEEERFAHHMRPSQVSFDITMDIKAQSITRRDPPQERKQSALPDKSPKNNNVAAIQNQIAILPRQPKRDSPFEEVKSPLPSQRKAMAAEIMNQAVDQILKEGQMTFGDASGFLMAAKDAAFFEKIQATGALSRTFVPSSPLILAEYFAFE